MLPPATGGPVSARCSSSATVMSAVSENLAYRGRWLVPRGDGLRHAGRMSRYAAARIVALPESLDELVGPPSGAVTLPRHIDWGPHYEYDLADEADLVLMYERVIREAQSTADLSAYLSTDLLRRHWTGLFLPTPARAAWQTRFP